MIDIFSNVWLSGSVLCRNWKYRCLGRHKRRNFSMRIEVVELLLNIKYNNIIIIKYQICVIHVYMEMNVSLALNWLKASVTTNHMGPLEIIHDSQHCYTPLHMGQWSSRTRNKMQLTRCYVFVCFIKQVDTC